MSASSTNKQAKDTPLLKQYRSIKAKYPETILFFRMGDFFETFGADAVITSKVTGIVLTHRGKGTAGETELAGFPHHQLDTYLPKMIRAGHRVAVCEQLEDPKLAKGIVKRDVVEVVTPGVLTSEKLLEVRQNTYVGAVVVQGGIAGMAYADVSTGEFVAGELNERQLAEQLESVGLSELLVARSAAQTVELAPYYIALNHKPPITKREDWIYHAETARQLLLEQFGTTSLKGFGIDTFTVGIVAAGAVLDYLRETRSTSALGHLSKVTRLDSGDYLGLDATTRRSLELFDSLSGEAGNSSLLSTLDETSTPMGARFLRRWLARPLRNAVSLERRFDAVDRLTKAREAREILQRELREIGDIERLCGRFVGARILYPRDYLSLKFALSHLPAIVTLTSSLLREDDEAAALLRVVAQELQPMTSLMEAIDQTVSLDPPSTPHHLGIIRDGANAELDELRSLSRNGKDRLLAIQMRERERTGIASLKVDFNNVFGYFIEVSNANRDKVPEDYIRRQTMVNAERYITQELKDYEAKILTAEERMFVIERELIDKLRARIVQETSVLQRNAQLLATLDVVVTFAALASQHRWVRPTLSTSGEFRIEQGRHPVVERLLPVGERFTPNSILFEPGQFEFYVITGPNMSGKSVYLRQAGLLAVMAHIGCFVPAQSATVPILDRIFTRVGASDNVANGESTFLVEMNEAANILNNATRNSLLLFDELGRGTSTFDGLSIAWALAEYVHDALPGARTLFATHYHELNTLTDRFPRIHNLKVEVREADGKVHFLHKIVPGYADHSYGIEVAAMAGIPPEVITRAREILRSLEETELTIAKAKLQREIPLLSRSERATRNDRLDDAFHDAEADAVLAELCSIDLNSLSPLEALNRISAWRNRLP